MLRIFPISAFRKKNIVEIWRKEKKNEIGVKMRQQWKKRKMNGGLMRKLFVLEIEVERVKTQVLSTNASLLLGQNHRKIEKRKGKVMSLNK